jgi:subtilisin family serine protease
MKLLLPPYTIDELFTPQSFQKMGAVDDWGYKFVNPQAFHDKGYKGRAVHFVIDTMDVSDHPDVEPKLLKEFCKSFIAEPAGDGNGHGTWVASRIAGLQDGVGVRGIAPSSVIVGVKALNKSGAGTDVALEQAIMYTADVQLPMPYNNWPRIINMSLGASVPMTRVETALKYAVGKGVIVVAAAGNSGYNGSNTINYPARYEDLAIAVGAFDSNVNPASFSSGGPEIDFAAPGVGLYGAWLNKGFSALNGTSMSTPIVAGVIDLLIQRYNLPLNQKAIEQALKQYAKDIFTPGFDVRTGDGTFILSDSDTPPPPPPAEQLVELILPFYNGWPLMFAGNGEITITLPFRDTDSLETLWANALGLIRHLTSRNSDESLKNLALKIKGATFAKSVSVNTGRIKITV